MKAIFSKPGEAEVMVVTSKFISNEDRVHYDFVMIDGQIVKDRNRWDEGVVAIRLRPM
jgi:hypothetical protein